jgi:hypothetical protein
VARKDVALGLTHHGTSPLHRMQVGVPPVTVWPREAIEVFGKIHNAATYRHWMREGLSQADPRFEFECAFGEATTNAATVHFNLDGLNLKKAWRRGQNTDPYVADLTNWEFVQVLKDTYLRNKVIFWQNGKQVPLSRVLERAGATLPP